MVEEEDLPPLPGTFVRSAVLAAAETAVTQALRVGRVLVAVRDAWNSLGEWFHG